jgi:hypothetical protein
VFTKKQAFACLHLNVMMTPFKLPPAGMALSLAACAGLAYAPGKYFGGLLSDSAGNTLYLLSKDHKSGDTPGDGFGDAWHVVRPEPRPPTGNKSH